MAWYDTNYQYKRQITISHAQVSGGSDLSSFPALVSLVESDLATVANGGVVQSSSGYDIIFIDSTETTLLNFEVEQYTATNGTLVAWIGISTLSHSSDTVIYMYYSNTHISSSQAHPTAVWDAYFQRVYHLNDNAANTTVKDSTLNAHNGTAARNTSNTYLSGGIIDGAQSLNGTSDYISESTTGLPTGAGAFTMEIWVTMPGTITGTYATLMEFGLFSGSDAQGARLDYGGGFGNHFALTSAGYGLGSVSGGSPTAGSNMYVAAIYDGSTAFLCVNGTQVASQSYAFNVVSSLAQIGTQEFGSYWIGPIDEARRSNINRSSGWIATCWNNQSNPGSFYSVGSAQFWIVGIGGTLGVYNIIMNNQAWLIKAGTLSVEGTIGKRSQAAFTVKASTATHFQQDQQVAIYDQTNTLAFSGYVVQPKEQKPGFQPSLLTQITCTDQHRLADKRIIAKAYTNQTRTTIVKDIFNRILSQEGVTLGAIIDEAGNVQTLYPSSTLYPSTTLYPQGSPTTGLLNSATFAYCTVAQALDALTKDANLAGVPYYWSIDQNKQFWWVPYTYITNNNTIDGTTIDQVYTPPSVTRANPTYRNAQYVIGGVAQTSLQTETRVGDGNAQSWAMGYDLASAPTVSINLGNGSGGYLGWVAQTVGAKGSSGLQFYWQQGSPTITQDSSGTKLRGTVGATVYNDLLQVSYIGQFPSVVYEQNDAQISYEASLDGTTGIVEEVEQDPTIVTLSDGLAKTSALLTRYATQGILFEFTIKGNPNGYAAGQLVPVNYGPHGLNNLQMLIEKVTASDQTDGVNIWYTIDVVVGPYDTTWTEFFATLIQQQQPSNSISVGASSGLILLQQFTTSLTPSATLTANAYACPLPGASLFPSTTLYPC